jgi:hypothetical protein
MKLNAGDFVKAAVTSERVSTLIRTWESKKSFDVTENMDAPTKTKAAAHFQSCLEASQAIGAQITAKAIERALKVVSGDGDVSAKDLGKMNEDISSRLCDELESVHFLCINSQKAAYYDPQEPPFGEQVKDNFPLAIYEIDEAGKCLALGRSTACVFHLMRTVEVGIRAVAAYIGIPDPIKPSDRNWGKILEKIATENQNVKPGPEKDFRQGIYASLDAIKDAWRNTTMHVEIKYTDEEAEEIYGFVRSFMKKIASRMDESGTNVAELLS